MGIFNTMMGGGAGNGLVFSQYNIATDEFKAAEQYSYKSTGTTYDPSGLRIKGYATTLFQATFPNAQNIGAYAFRGQTQGHFYFPAITSTAGLSQSAFMDGGVNYFPNLEGTINDFYSYFAGANGFIASKAIVASVYNMEYWTCSTSGSIGVYTGTSSVRSLVLYGLSASSFGFAVASNTLQYVSIPNINAIASNGFVYCYRLEEALFPNCITVGSSGFYACSRLQKVSLPACTTIYNSAFLGCYALTSINLPNCTTIYSNAFYNCSNLKTISLPKCTSIGESAFGACYKLTSIYLPSCTSIGSSAFSECSNLSLVSFGKHIPSLYGTFYNCSKLSKIYLTGCTAVPSIGWTTFNYTPIESTQWIGTYGSIYVPKSLYNAFITAAVWANYSSRIVSV